MFEAKVKATPSRGTGATHFRVRRDRVDGCGRVTLRHQSRLPHIAIGRAHARPRVVLLVADLDVRVLDEDGALLRHLTIDPTRSYQALGRG